MTTPRRRAAATRSCRASEAFCQELGNLEIGGTGGWGSGGMGEPGDADDLALQACRRAGAAPAAQHSRLERRAAGAVGNAAAASGSAPWRRMRGGAVAICAWRRGISSVRGWPVPGPVRWAAQAVRQLNEATLQDSGRAHPGTPEHARAAARRCRRGAARAGPAGPRAGCRCCHGPHKVEAAGGDVPHLPGVCGAGAWEQLLASGARGVGAGAGEQLLAAGARTPSVSIKCPHLLAAKAMRGSTGEQCPPAAHHSLYDACVHACWRGRAALLPCCRTCGGRWPARSCGRG